ncbi:hypothetical protein ACFPES_14640 [Paenibacillus sp. GCM10023248]|uniref:hypothetical protein n=1 Tax=Bacillales TaxID=1385 RepID=UPI0023781EEB|nr:MULTISPECIES: hypothetical protein [Bacillales]MDD9268274.1 hypothetical protein [Paenibacillus sp. MAHUQ-63]MDR6879952.1 hypothetical protein [Bacillus sp. 3255]
MRTMNKAMKWLMGAALIAAIAVPTTVCAKPEAKPEMASGVKAGVLLAAKPEAKPEAG